MSRAAKKLVGGATLWIVVCLLTGHAAAQSQDGRPAPAQPDPQPPAAAGTPPLEIAGARLRGFLVGSFSVTSRIQMVPEFAGGAPALADPGSTNFRFDKFGLSVNRVFTPWLSASAAVELELHRDRHSHGFDPAFGCPGSGGCFERFGTEEAETEATLDRFSVNIVAPLGNGVAFSVGRFDVPFGIERHDEPLNLTATSSELFQFARPQRMTGLQAAYAVSPNLDLNGWVVNRWESETTGDGFDDNNKAKTLGGRLGFTPMPRERLLNIGVGGSYGAEQEEGTSKRWIVDVDVTAAPSPQWLITAELLRGGEDAVSFRERGVPFPAPAVTDQDVRWWGLYVLPHYDFSDWAGLTLRYGYLDDEHGARTGVAQTLQSVTIMPMLHLSRLANLGDTGTAYPRTRHPIHWLELKLEYRLNRSNQPVFSDGGPGASEFKAGKSSHQFQVQFVMNL